MFNLPKDKPSLIDLCCCAGGAARGYQRAGFYVVGIDKEDHPNYAGDEFYKGDAVEFFLSYGHLFDAAHASPPCQEYSSLRSLKTKTYATLIEPIREIFVASGKPYVIENVPGAPLINPLMLCGTMFGLRVIRHRYFENNINLHFAPFACNHWGRTQPKNDKRGTNKSASLEKYSFLTVTGHDFRNADGSKAMGIDWMTNAELAEAIPPAYTEYIGVQLVAHLAQSSSRRTLHAPDNG